MAITDEGNGMVMPVAPMYGGFGNGGFGAGGDWWGILLLIALLNGGFGGWGMGGMMGGFGGMALGYDFPWLLNGQNGINNNVNDGFRDAQLHDSVTSVRDGVSNLATQLCDCCGQTQMSIANSTAALQNGICNGFNGVNSSIAGAQSAISNQLYNNEIASLNRSFAEQTANMQGFNGVNASLADVKYTEATEACATRTAAATNTRDIIDSQTRGTQAILDKLCQLELDGVKGQVAAEQRENANLRAQLSAAQFAASQAAQTATFERGLTNEVDALYNRLKNCPVNTVPVAGNTPLFSCNPSFNNGGCGCGCGAFGG